MDSNNPDAVSKYSFLEEPPNSLVCGICLEVAEEPRQHVTCGKLLCKKCLEEYGNKKPCPNCRGVNPQYFPDSRSKLSDPSSINTLVVLYSQLAVQCHLQAEISASHCHPSTPTGKREIKDLPVRCGNVERGCKWEETVGMLEQHVGKCEFTLVKCPNKCKGNRFMRRDLDEHLKNDCSKRDYSCQYCGEKGTYAYITGPHDSKRRQFPVAMLDALKP
jgi:TNF receptor-associated factor 4